MTEARCGPITILSEPRTADNCINIAHRMSHWREDTVQKCLRRVVAAAIVLFILFATSSVPISYRALAQEAGCQTFPQTARTVCGPFLKYWLDNGGLDQNGYPISDQMQELSDTDGKTYTVQYF